MEIENLVSIKQKSLSHNVSMIELLNSLKCYWQMEIPLDA